MGISFMCFGKHPSHEEQTPQRFSPGMHVDEQMRRRAYAAGYEDARRDAFGDMHEDMEARRRRRASFWDDMPPRHENRAIGFTARDEMEPMRGMARPLGEAGDAAMEAVERVMKSPPETWANHLQKGDLPGIVKMEMGELTKALDSGKGLKDIKKELTHTLAALMLMTAR